MNNLPKGYLGLQMLNGYASTYKDGSIKTLAVAVDQWIEKNTTLLTQIIVSPEFYSNLEAETGYPVLVVDTLVGSAPLFVDRNAKEPVVVL